MAAEPEPSSSVTKFRQPHAVIRIPWDGLMDRGFPEPGDTWEVTEVNHNEYTATLCFDGNKDEQLRKEQE